jgi:hypothetical protein
MVRYREKLTPSIPFHLALALVIPMGFGMLAPINIGWGVASAVFFYALALLIFVVLAPRIVVTENEFRAGRAQINRQFIGTVVRIERDGRQKALADARTWSLVRAWIPEGVLITLSDPADPTPSWYVSTRHPEKLEAALTSTS